MGGEVWIVLGLHHQAISDLLIQGKRFFCLLVSLDRNQTVLQRVKPNPRTASMNEQFNDSIQQWAMGAMTRHGGDKQSTHHPSSRNPPSHWAWTRATALELSSHPRPRPRMIRSRIPGS